jgi:hypothetical protein
VFHPEPLLLVDDDEPEILEPHGLLQDPVRTNDDVHAAVRDARHRGLGLGGSGEPGQLTHNHREWGHSVAEVAGAGAAAASSAAPTPSRAGTPRTAPRSCRISVARMARSIGIGFSMSARPLVDRGGNKEVS